jgi:hypothetical protein
LFDDELSAISASPPRTGVLPGMRLRNAMPRSTIVLLIVFIAFFVFLPLSILSSDPKAKLSFGPTQTQQGGVLSSTETRGCRDKAAHTVVYAFSSASGGEFRGAAVVCEGSPYYDVRQGDRIEVRYLSRDPAVNAIAGTNFDDEPPVLLFLLFPFFFLLILSPLYLPQLREVLRARRLYKTGELAMGEVVFVKRRSLVSWPGWPGSTTADVFVAHDMPGGGRAESVVVSSNDWLLNQLAPGTRVRVLRGGKSDRGVLLEAYVR